jgi:hypothetical protein
MDVFSSIHRTLYLCQLLHSKLDELYNAQTVAQH